MRKAYILTFMGKPLVVSENGTRLHEQAADEARLTPDRTHRLLRWNIDGTRLFRHDVNGHARFTGYEVKEVVRV